MWIQINLDTGYDGATTVRRGIAVEFLDRNDRKISSRSKINMGNFIDILY